MHYAIAFDPNFNQRWSKIFSSFACCLLYKKALHKYKGIRLPLIERLA